MDVFFEPHRGEPFTIEVGFFDTVLEIKEKIEKYHDVPISKQTLVFNGQVLQDDYDVAYYEILQGSHVQLLVVPSETDHNPALTNIELDPSTKIQLTVKTPTSKTHVVVEMDVNDTVGMLKEKIRETEAVPVNRLVLHSGGSELQDHRRLRDFDQLSDNAEIEVSVTPSPTTASAATIATTTTAAPAVTATMSGTKKLKVMVQLKCGTKKIPVELNASDNVGELRKELQKLQQRLQFHLPPEGYFFIYKQNVMDDDRSFRWHHVSQGDTIEIFNGSVSGGS
ncbi:hypothetical protein FNV43_RR07765 [Rhamnella rubrinervis]|uniref:Ubiquitin-like domain-containing protein n=1 Tax=Rhamnella rubrinervis TaxID=2594499 RepID=A0A8K0MMQ8_9ROSA|nr:hypothetical protein FNV43_RR07765 [Rhamnella rubrinervis]